VKLVLDDGFNPEFFSYPSLFMYAMAGVYSAACSIEIAARIFPDMRACIEADWLKLIVAARALSALAGVAGVVAVFAIARRLEPAAAFPAAILLSVSFLHVRDSHFGVTDVAMTSMLLWALLLLLRADEQPSVRRFAIAGFVTGLAASTKYNAILLLTAAVVSQIRVWLELRAPVSVKHARLALVAACSILGFLIGTPYALCIAKPVRR
jgi:dolichyl-phosphate-mannose--protein O-mannosyl transferase